MGFVSREPTMRRKFMRELPAFKLPRSPGPDVNLATITEADFEPLPETARRYLRFMGVVGRPRNWSFRLRFKGWFRRSRDEAWMKCEAWQYNTRLALARIFYIQLRFLGVVPMNFETMDRFYADPKDPAKMMRCRWTTPMEGFQEIDGRRMPTRGKAVWHPPEGELAYADFTLQPGSVAFNVAPGE